VTGRFDAEEHVEVREPSVGVDEEHSFSCSSGERGDVHREV